MTTETSKEEEARQAEADAEGLFAQILEAENLPAASSLESNPIIQRLPSSVKQVEDVSILAEDGKRVTVSAENLTADQLNQYPRNSNEGGSLNLNGQTITGKRIVFRTDTGQPVPVLTYFLPTVLQKKRDDGKLAFTLRDPGFRPPKGEYPCYLNSKAVEAEAFHRMGFPECPMGELPTPTDRDDHMLNKHKSEWRRIEDIRVRGERQEDREMARNLNELLSSQLKGSDSSPAPVVEAVAPVAASAAETHADFQGEISTNTTKVKETDQISYTASCDKCDKTTTGKSQRQANNFLRMHSKKHAED